MDTNARHPLVIERFALWWMAAIAIAQEQAQAAEEAMAQ